MKPQLFKDSLKPAERKILAEYVSEASKPNTALILGKILLDWACIIVCIWLAELSKSYLFIAFAWIVIGARQHALLIFVHEAAHRNLSKNKFLNDLISNFFCAYPLFVKSETYRDSHLSHHQYTNTEKDPDWMRKLGDTDWEFPKSKFRVFTLLVKDLFGNGILEMIKKVNRFGKAKKVHASRLYFLFYPLAIAAITYFSAWKQTLIYWFIPAFVILPFLLRLRSLAEHFGVSYKHELSHTRTVLPGFIEKFFLAPHNVHFHLEHHLYPSVSMTHLKTLHKKLLEMPEFQKKAWINSSYLLPSKHPLWADLAGRPQKLTVLP